MISATIKNKLQCVTCLNALSLNFSDTQNVFLKYKQNLPFVSTLTIFRANKQKLLNPSTENPPARVIIMST